MAKEINCKVGRGSFFINTFKTEEGHPDYKGSINIEGTAEELAVWVRCEDNDINKQFLRCVCQATKVTFIMKPVKKDNDKMPDFKGNFQFSDKKWDVAGWMTETQTTHVPYCSVKVSVHEEGTGSACAPTGFPTFGNTNIYQGATYPKAPQSEPSGQPVQGTTEEVGSNEELPF